MYMHYKQQKYDNFRRIFLTAVIIEKAGLASRHIKNPVSTSTATVVDQEDREQ